MYIGSVTTEYRGGTQLKFPKIVKGTSVVNLDSLNPNQDPAFQVNPDPGNSDPTFQVNPDPGF
jgi:hypothetical protein